jgi:CrcB protein
MPAWLAVALGGAIGSVARFKLSTWVLEQAAGWRFPLGTFSVNILGCLIIGVLAGLAVKEDFFSAETRLFFFTGITGGFTTFSALGLETFYLLRRGEVLIAGGYVLSSLVCGLLVLWAGYALMASQVR